MSDFKAKMRKIRFPTPKLYLRGPTSKGMAGKEGGKRKGTGEESERRGMGKGRGYPPPRKKTLA